MSRDDQGGHPVQLESQKALDAWNATVRGFLAHSARTPEYLQTVMQEAPGFALARIAMSFFLLLLGRAELTEEARRNAAEIESLARQGALDARERRYAVALEEWLRGRPSAAAAELEGVHRRWPGDALALKLSHGIRFMLGQRSAMRGALEDALGVYGPDHPLAGFMHGCYAFALEETGAYRSAEGEGRRALDLAPDDAWALHAVTHVYDMTGQSSHGADFVLENRSAWGHCNNFRYHVWWHLALFHLDMGDYDAVLTLYDHRIRADGTDDYRDIANATSLLARLELEGVDVRARWKELADLAERRINDASVVFADLHYMLALTGDKRTGSAQRLIQRLDSSAAAPSGEMDAVAARAGVPVAEGLQAFKNTDYQGAYQLLAKARPHLESIGGSHAQRDVFARITIDAAIRAGAVREARGLIEQRERERGATDRFSRSRAAWIDEARRHPETAV
ncbi:tetratricopeptide repeat protein [Dichotomicrobium thermohalophilum]|uniref:Tetratricopeptide repeat protein 38 n=1 Tax=Dichotomicrobium thermohalophilum TaxID=933063 RepID=A0A397Q2A9_9HYPH|nr:tetratricopeptide repeat protein [Dichotomicrobium thermohalophilum]RIA55506.1 hypothetical protein BXY53_0572 [Dichotomicrobium thermohalophilum]